jgi:hypothetical protein
MDDSGTVRRAADARLSAVYFERFGSETMMRTFCDEAAFLDQPAMRRLRLSRWPRSPMIVVKNI